MAQATTLTQLATDLAISKKQLMSVIDNNGIEIDMLHRNCAMVTEEQIEKIINVLLDKNLAKIDKLQKHTIKLKRQLGA